MIRKIIKKEGRPFASAAKKCHLDEYGYIEEEYFFYGMSNVYGQEKGRKTIIHEEIEYCNRMIVRRPGNLADFSGVVCLELMNASYYIDLDRVWVLAHGQFLRNGDIYVGITSKPSVLSALKKVNYNRYQELYWAAAQEAILPEELLGNIHGASSTKTEDGLIWDMITDLARILKKKRMFLSEYAISCLVLSGWSQSGGYIIRYLKDFSDEINRERLFDGFFSCGSGSISMPALNQNQGQTAQQEDRKLYILPQPFMEIHTESENYDLGNETSRGENGNKEGYRYRIYDIPGATHDSVATMTAYYLKDEDIHWSGIVPVYPGKEPRPNDYPYELVFRRAWQYLCDWIRDGKEPPIYTPIEVQEDGSNRTDLNGNAKGGWRLPQVDFATRTYYPHSTPMKPEYELEAKLFGYMEALTYKGLKEQYKDFAAYKTMIEKELQKYVIEGYLLEEDKMECLNDILRRAREDGLEERV